MFFLYLSILLLSKQIVCSTVIESNDGDNDDTRAVAEYNRNPSTSDSYTKNEVVPNNARVGNYANDDDQLANGNEPIDSDEADDNEKRSDQEQQDDDAAYIIIDPLESLRNDLDRAYIASQWQNPDGNAVSAEIDDETAATFWDAVAESLKADEAETDRSDENLDALLSQAFDDEKTKSRHLDLLNQILSHEDEIEVVPVIATPSEKVDCKTENIAPYSSNAFTKLQPLRQILAIDPPSSDE